MISTAEAVRHFAARTPQQIAVRAGAECLTYHALEERAREIARELERREIGVAALAADNGPTWLVVDLAAQLAGTVLVPLPPFFVREQIAHAVADSGADALLADPRLLTLREFDVGTLEPFAALGDLAWCRLRANPAAPMPPGTAKISYTSGTTGKPKGVCLRQASMDAVANSVRAAVAELEITRHLCVLPLATLLENIAGVYAPLLNGAEIVARERDRSLRRIALRRRAPTALRRDLSSAEHHSRAATADRDRSGARARRDAADEPPARGGRRRPRVSGAARTRRSSRFTGL
jgi:long-subunit acyl-CoA synthetase (AMP-forming)